MSRYPDPGVGYRAGDTDEEKYTSKEIERRSIFTRWGWPLFSLAALVIFELTASLTWSSVVFALRFGWKDAYAGCCFWWRDQERSRGLAIALLHFSSATSKVFSVCLFSLVVLDGLSKQNGGQGQMQQPGMVIISLTLAFLGGVFASGFFGSAAILICRWTGRKMWVDRQSYQQSIDSDWPPRRFDSNRSPTICFFTMIPITTVFMSLTLFLPLVFLLDRLKRELTMWPIVFLSLSLIASGLFFFYGVHWFRRTITAMTPFECWPELLDLPNEECLEIMNSVHRPDEGIGLHRVMNRGMDIESVLVKSRRP